MVLTFQNSVLIVSSLIFFSFYWNDHLLRSESSRLSLEKVPLSLSLYKTTLFFFSFYWKDHLLRSESSRSNLEKMPWSLSLYIRSLSLSLSLSLGFWIRAPFWNFVLIVSINAHLYKGRQELLYVSITG